jgi:hypothetical protein
MSSSSRGRERECLKGGESEKACTAYTAELIEKKKVRCSRTRLLFDSPLSFLDHSLLELFAHDADL